MNDVFQKSKLVPKEILQTLQTKSNQPAMIRFSVQYTLFILTIIGFFFLKNPILLSLNVLCYALLLASLFAPLHECSHYTAFRDKKWNEIIAWLSGFPLMLVPTGYREFHYEHHRHTHVLDKDPELMVGGAKLAFWSHHIHEYLILMSGIFVVIAKIGILGILSIGLSKKIWAEKLAFVREKWHQTIVWEARIYVLIYSLLALVGYLYFPQVTICLLAGLMLAHSILAFYLAAEHTGLPTEGSVFEKGRSMKANALVRFFMWNMPYHVEHHAYPSVPFFAIPTLHKVISPELPHKDTYWALHWKVIKKLRRL